MATCSGCAAQWNASATAHCGSCHRSFSGVSLFDRHRYITQTSGGCIDPAELMSNGKRVAFLRDGVWRYPELTDDQRVRMFGQAS